MSKPKRFANEKVMEDYLGGLLSGHEQVEQRDQQTQKLFSNVDLGEVPLVDDVVETPAPEPELMPEPEPQSEPQLQVEDQPAAISQDALVDSLEDSFQALFFEVAGLTLAVPLVTLGGIHQIDKIGPLFGKPSWFMGVMLHREEKLSVVDTAKWVMPEKVTQKLQQGLHYNYLIMLAESSWGLASEKLVNTITLNKSDVKWRAKDSKRPWLAGMVKQRMCALIDVYQLISMLNKGLSSDSQD